MRFGHCDICDRYAPLSFTVYCGIETYYCSAHTDQAPAWAERVRYWRIKTLPDIHPGYQPWRENEADTKTG